MRESDFQTKFTYFLKKYWNEGTAVCELKLARGRRLPLKAIRPHQLVALRLASKGKLVYKIPDSGYDQKPADCFVITKSSAYLVVQFYEAHTKTNGAFYMIPIDTVDKWLEEGKKSFTEDECQEFKREF